MSNQNMENNREHLYTQKVYPNVNNDDHLEFRIPPNSKGQLDLGNVMLHFKVDFPDPKTQDYKILPQNFLGPKQFSSLEVRVNGEAVTRRSCANEYFLGSYFQNLLNYSVDYQISAFRSFGIFDYAQENLAGYNAFSATKKLQFHTVRDPVGPKKCYDIVMPIDANIFYSNDLLPSNTPLELSFERLKGSNACLITKDVDQPEFTFELKDCFLTVPFKRDEDLFHLENNAIQRPIKLNFDEYTIRRFNLTRGSDNVMMSELISGQLPNKLFWGLQTMTSYGGSFKDSGTRFSKHGMIKASMFINGKEMDGFPVTMADHNITQPFVKFLENARQHQNAYLSRTLTQYEFDQCNFLLSATIEPQTVGSVSFSFEFENAISADLVLIVCGIYDKTMRIDHLRNFQVT